MILRRIVEIFTTSQFVKLFIFLLTFFLLLLPFELFFGKYLESAKDKNATLYFIVVLMALAVSATSYLFVRNLRSSATTIPFNVAIIGFPQSGKTTLIASLFQEIFKQNVEGIKATLKGESTIDRINMLIERKESGMPVGPTNDQTMFAYRTNILLKRGGFSREYKVEFGDYPGEYSEMLSDTDYFGMLKNSEYFRWCVEADAYIFIVDVGKYIISSDKARFIATTSKMIRQSLQHFMDYSFIGERKFRSRPILIVFNKMDLCNYIETSTRVTSVESIDKLVEIAFSMNFTPPVTSLDREKYDLLSDHLFSSFEDLILYIRSESKQLNILFTSSFGTINNQPTDIPKLLKFILPRF
jgi:GTPase SAR1 family protein